MSPEQAVGAVGELVSMISRDGRPVVRMCCADYGSEWESAGPYVFKTAEEARVFIDTSLLALRVLGCDVS